MSTNKKMASIAKEDTEFLLAINKSDRDFMSSAKCEEEYAIIASTYYGFLIGTKGSIYANKVKQLCRNCFYFN